MAKGSAAKKEALSGLITDANSARLGKRLPKDKRERLLHLIKEELGDDDKESDDGDGDADKE